MRFSRNGSFRTAIGLGTLAAMLSTVSVTGHAETDHHAGYADRSFNRITTFPVVFNTCADEVDEAFVECVDQTTVAEIVAASEDGNLLIYTDSETKGVGFIDIADPYNPMPGGTLPVGGEPTSVAVAGGYALVAVVAAESTFSDPKGFLQVVDISTRTVVREIDLGGQPDSIAVSPDRGYAAVAIENERNEALCVGGEADSSLVIEEDEEKGTVTEEQCVTGGGRVGGLPQAPAGFLQVVRLEGEVSKWTVHKVELTGIADQFPNDPEPEFVDINSENIAAVTLQENNHVVLVDLHTREVVGDFSANRALVRQVDSEDNSLIELRDTIELPREPDAIAWIGESRLASADEGDLDGGTRGFTIFDQLGEIHFRAGNSLEHNTVRLGHYPEDRSDNKGNEPEGVEFGDYGETEGRYLFVGSERSNIIEVYRLGDDDHPTRVQTLPTSTGPEGLLAIPSRGLLVVASEVDSRGAFRSSVTVYQLQPRRADYPTIASADRSDGLPISWGALSALAADRQSPYTMYSVYDSFYRKSRIFEIDTLADTPLITGEIVLKVAYSSVQNALQEASIEVEDDATINLDAEGIATRPDGGFWIASEGSGTVGDEERPFESLNLLLRSNEAGVIERVVTLPEATNARQVRFGFEGVAVIGSGDHETVYVAFQREWAGDPEGFVRIGRYLPNADEWAFFYYELDAVESPNKGWVGLSELTALNDHEFAVVERDNQGGPDGLIKRIYRFSVAGKTPAPEGEAFPVLAKNVDIAFVTDLVPALTADGGQLLEKVEGLAKLRSGDVYIVTDNDGVSDASGETQMINLGPIF